MTVLQSCDLLHQKQWNQIFRISDGIALDLNMHLEITKLTSHNHNRGTYAVVP